jgi:hypothetical protein
MRTEVTPAESEECLAHDEGHCQHWYDGEPCCRCKVLHAVDLSAGVPEGEEAWQKAQNAVCSDCAEGRPAIAPTTSSERRWTHPGDSGMVVDRVCLASAILNARFPARDWLAQKGAGR